MALPPPTSPIQPETREAWRAWLGAHPARTEGVWLVSYKKAAGKMRLSYDEIVEEALCFGWVDAKPGKLDDERTMLYFAPRKPGSGWSRPNKERIERLMAPAGLAKVEAAQRDGSWGALDAVERLERLELPADLTAALAEHGDARANFDAFPRSVKRGILEWIRPPAEVASTFTK